MSDQNDNWKDSFKEFEEETPAVTEDSQDKTADENFSPAIPEDSFGSEVLEKGDTFPIDESYFDPDADHIGLTNIIPRDDEMKALAGETTKLDLSDALDDDLDEDDDSDADDDQPEEERMFRRKRRKRNERMSESTSNRSTVAAC